MKKDYDILLYSKNEGSVAAKSNFTVELDLAATENWISVNPILQM